MLRDLKIRHEGCVFVTVSRAELVGVPSAFETPLERPQQLVQVRVEVRPSENPKDLALGLLQPRERRRGLSDSLLRVDQLRRTRKRRDAFLDSVRVE